MLALNRQQYYIIIILFSHYRLQEVQVVSLLRAEYHFSLYINNKHTSIIIIYTQLQSASCHAQLYNYSHSTYLASLAKSQSSFPTTTSLSFCLTTARFGLAHTEWVIVTISIVVVVVIVRVVWAGVIWRIDIV